MAQLEPHLREYYDQLEEMFATSGWRTLCEEAAIEIEQLRADALESRSWEDVQFFKGRAFQLATIINLATEARGQRALLEEEAELEES